MKHKRSISKSSSVTPGAVSNKTKINYKKPPAGASANYRPQVSSRTSTATSGPTLRESYVTYNESSSPSIPDVAGTAISIATPNQSPLPQGKGELVFFVGTALIILSGMTSKNIPAILDLLVHGSKMKYTGAQARNGMVVVGGEFLFLMVLTAFSEQSEGFSNVALALLFVLFLIWTMQNIKTIGGTKAAPGWLTTILGGNKNI